jgi:spore germination protein
MVRLLLMLLILGMGSSILQPAIGPAMDESTSALAAVETDDVTAAAVRPDLVDPAVATLPTNRPLRLAYYFPQDPTSLDSLRANIRSLDIVAPHWLEIDREGTVTTLPSAAAAAYLKTTNVMVLPSVALTGRGAGHEIVTNADVMAESIRQLLAAVEPWDGLFLDSEGMDAADRPHLSWYINVLGSALHERGKFYAIALPAKTRDERTGWSGSYDYAAIKDAADLYLVMAYGFRTGTSSTAGSSAPLPWMDASMAYAVTELAPEKLILGVPFYGYDWNVTKGPPARALRFRDTRELMDRTGATPTIHREQGSAMFEYTVGGERHEVWYEDSRSLAPKLNLVQKYKLRGVGAWRLGQEDPRAWTIWDQMLTTPTYAAELPR